MQPLFQLAMTNNHYMYEMITMEQIWTGQIHDNIQTETQELLPWTAVTGMMEWSQKSQKNPYGFQQNPKTSLDQTFTSKNSHADFVALKSFKKG